MTCGMHPHQPRSDIAVGALVLLVLLLGSTVMAFAATSVTQEIGGVTSPGGVLWLPGPAGTPGHLWVSDTALGLCRVDAGVLTNCNTTARTPGQASFDAATSSVYLPDASAAGAGVSRLHFNQASETFDSATLLRPTDGLGGSNRPTATALDPISGALYIGFARTPNIVRITNPSVGVGDPKVVIGNSSDGKQTFSMVFLSLPAANTLVEADSRGLGQIANPAGCAAGCNATPFGSAQISGPLSLTAQNGTLLYVGTASSVWRLDTTVAQSAANPDVYASGLSFVSALGLDPQGTLHAGDDGTRGSVSGRGHVWKIVQVAATAPAAPTGVSATAGDGQATVSWTAPASDGGSPITSYTITSSPAGASLSVAAPATSASVTGLANGTTYSFTVSATNVVGPGPASAVSNSVTPAAPVLISVPGAPTAVSASAGNAQASVSWTAPTSTAGSAITSYTITSSPAGGSVTVPGTSTSATVTGLTNGTAYTFTVTATNVAGAGPASVPSNSVTPATVPGAPTAVSASAGNAQATVSWTAPASDGGSPITSYTITSSPAGASLSVAAVATSATVTGLTNGTTYTFTVTATNVAGAGPASVPSNSVTPVTAPGAPTAVSATAGNAQASVSWTAPTSTGGSAITSYTITSSPAGGSVTVPGTSTSATVTGLTNGTAYTFTVTATSAVGTSPASAPSSSVTPFTVPGAPTAVSAAAGGQEATISWTPPGSDGGSAITSYTVTAAPGGASATVPGTTTTATVIGLTDGTAYTFTVVANNAAGSGPASAPSNSVIPSGLPSPVITQNPPNPTGDPNATFAFSSSIPNATFACSLVSLDSVDAFSACTSPTSQGPLADGTYVFKVTATDPVSGLTGAPAVYQFAVSTSVAPSATAPVAEPQPGGTATTKTVPVTISWSATACSTGVDGCNIASYRLQRSVNGLAFGDVALPTPTTTSIVEALLPSPTNQAGATTYVYQVQAVDAQGNVSPFAVGSAFTVATIDDTGTVSYAGAWSSSAVAGAFGGAVHSSSLAGASATLPNAFSGSGAALVSTLGPDRGIAQVVLDGQVVATVDLYAATQSAANVVWSIDGLSTARTHTLKVTVLGTQNTASVGARVDVDGIVVIH